MIIERPPIDRYLPPPLLLGGCSEALAPIDRYLPQPPFGGYSEAVAPIDGYLPPPPLFIFFDYSESRSIPILFDYSETTVFYSYILRL